MLTSVPFVKVLQSTFKNVPLPSIKMSSITRMIPQGRIVEITGQNIHYEKIGNGHHNVLLLPGFLGSTRTDFAPQLEKFSHQDFTIYSLDPPGYGFSRPLADGTCSKKLLHTHSEFAVKLMQMLNVEKVSLVGWSNGGMAAIITAANNPQLVRSMVLIGASSHYRAEEVENGKTIMRNIDCWSEKQRTTMINLYGEEYLRQLCANSIDCLFTYYENYDFCTNDLKNIQCPTLITHGTKDVLINPDHAKHLHQNIRGSIKVVEFADGRHDIHLQFAEKFNKIAQDFLKEN